MLFHSPGFLFVFLPLFLLAALVLPKGVYRSITLLVFSYLFYSGAEPLFVLILLFSSVVDYMVAWRIYSAISVYFRRFWLLISLGVNLGVLLFFKYGAWVFGGLSPFLIQTGIPVPDSDYFSGFILPAGISFYTFQTMSYTIDVYRRQIKPEPSILGFLNFVAYLPQLIAGPIERYHQLAPQINDYVIGKTRSLWSAGLDRVSLGIAQKLLIADSCGLIVDRLINQGADQSFVTAWAVAVGFGMQIYYDFAGYTHMAIGISLLLGIRLQENFLSPYKATNIRDFWRRWHITLSTWFRDYLYIPLGGSKKGNVRTVFNVTTTFFLCGLWHGAGFNFIIWGLLHGLLVGMYNVKHKVFPWLILNKYVALAITFAVVSFTWVPFRVSETSEFLSIWKAMLGFGGFSSVGVSATDIVFICLVTIGTLIAPNAFERWPGRSGWLESTALVMLAVFAILVSPEVNKFIYFQF